MHQGRNTRLKTSLRKDFLLMVGPEGNTKSCIPEVKSRETSIFDSRENKVTVSYTWFSLATQAKAQAQ